MLKPSDRVRAPISTSELERRWSAIRSAMEASGLDALLVYNNTDVHGGYVRYFTDLGTGPGDAMAIVFPAAGEMTVVMHGPADDGRPLGDDERALLRGVGAVISAWSFSSVAYTSRYDAEAIVRALAPFARGRIGLVGLAQLPYAVLSQVKDAYPRASFADAADVVDPVKAVKSAEERELIRAVARQQEAAFAAALAAIKPGVPEHVIVEAALRASRDAGADGGVLMIGAGQPGEQLGFHSLQHQNRPIQAGDHLVLLIETSGPGGLYSEVGRTVVVGRATDQMRAEHAFTAQAQEYCTSLLKPGATPRTVFAAYNEFLREHGRPEERRVHCHGQGYDAVERPLVRSDESMELVEHVNLACHPMYYIDGFTHWLCDGFFITNDGVSKPHHQVARTIFETS